MEKKGKCKKKFNRPLKNKNKLIIFVIFSTRVSVVYKTVNGMAVMFTRIAEMFTKIVGIASDVDVKFISKEISGIQ